MPKKIANARYRSCCPSPNSLEKEDVPVLEFLYLVFTRMLGESYRRRLGSLLLHLCYVFRALSNALCVLILNSLDYVK